jgi:hypothetical protein
MGYAKIKPLEVPMPEPEREAVTWKMMPGNEAMHRKMNLRLWLRGQVNFQWLPEYGRYVNMSNPSRLRAEATNRA